MSKVEYEVPVEKGYTIYSKSGCPNCIKAKKEIASENPTIVDCDDYIIEDKDEFLFFMKTLIGKEHRFFPMIFKDGVFIGGYVELCIYLENEEDKKNAFSDDVGF